MSGLTSGAAHQHCLCHPPPLSSANKGGRDFRDRATVDASPVVIGDFEVLLDEAAEQAERTREAQRRPPRRITAQ